MAEDRPVYGIGAVQRMTSIPVATLRAWERRYGYPHCTRTAGGHRLYSGKDIEYLKWIAAQVEQGIHTSQAVRAAQRMEAEGIMPGPRMVYQVAAPDTVAGQVAHAALDALQRHVTASLMVNDLSGVDRILSQEGAIYAPEDLILRVIMPTLRDLGDAWEGGEAPVCTVQLASEYLRERLVLWFHTGPPAYSRQPIVLACAPGELHECSLLAFGTLLRRRRWPIAYVGQSVPLLDLSALIAEIRPVALVWSAMQEETARTLADMPPLLVQTAEEYRTHLALGGRAFVQNPEWRDRMQATYLGDTLQQGVETLERLLNGAR